MSNTLPPSIDTVSSEPEKVIGSGSRFLKSEKGKSLHGVVMNPEEITKAQTSDGYPLISKLMVGNGRDSDITQDGENQFSIIDMRNLPIATTVRGTKYKEFRGELVAENIPYILAGKPSAERADKGKQTAFVGLRKGELYSHGRATATTSEDDRRRRFASNNMTSRNQFGIYVDLDGVLGIYDAGSANGTSIEWGMSEDPSYEAVDDKTVPRAKILGGIGLKGAGAEQLGEAPESFTSLETAISAIDKKSNDAYGAARMMGSLVNSIINQTDAPKEVVLKNAGELVVDLNSLLPEHVEMMNLGSSLDLLRIAVRTNDIETAKAQYGYIVSAMGKFAESRSRWFEQKTETSDAVGSSASSIVNTPYKHFRRTVNATQQVGFGADAKPVLQFLKERLS
jgi:hypothetical protein